VGLANALRDGSKSADVYMSADAQVNALLMGEANGNLVQRYVVFARNEVVLVYSPKSRHRVEFEQAAAGSVPWYEVLRRPGLRLVRGNPNLDPLAYYTVLVAQLAEQHYGIPGLKQQILGDDLNPDQLAGLSFAGLENGDVDAILMYRNIALDRGWPYLELPAAVNLSDVSLADSYARASFTTSRGHTFRGVPIGFSAAVLATATHPGAAAELIDYVLSPVGQELLRSYHLTPMGG
jgi:molybdate/tungstate transport system substrate-binding protein